MLGMNQSLEEAHTDDSDWGGGGGGWGGGERRERRDLMCRFWITLYIYPSRGLRFSSTDWYMYVHL